MNPWRQFPMVRLILPVCSGMAAGIFFDAGLQIPLLLPAVLFLCLGIVVTIRGFIFPYSYRWVTGFLILVLTSLFSYRIMLSGQDIHKLNYFGNYQPRQRLYIGEITEPVIQKQKSTKVVFKVRWMKEKEGWIPAEGKAQVYIGRRGGELLCYGDRLVVSTIFTLPEGSRNPGGFDNRRYLRMKGIYRQAYVKPDSWKVLIRGTRNPVFRMALSWRDRLLMILRNNGVHGREFAVAGALLLGYVDEIDNDLMRDYSATGVMHILSVSGMHVGMIFLVLDKLLGFLEKKRKGVYVKTIFVIVFIWMYALITGLSPAVLRAAAMLSFIVTGKALKRHPDILNILASSMIFLLVWEPTLLADLGFQLSYLAVAGIVLLYKPIYDLFVPENGFVDKIWSIVAVSISAQIVTLPLCLYYFHQFPNYFMITNIIVIPLSNLIIYTGILTLALGSLPWVPLIVAKALSLMVWFLNAFIHWMGSLPCSVTRGIAITFTESILLYLILITGAVFISGKNKKWLFITLFLMILFSGNIFREGWERVSAGSFTVYDARGAGLYDFTSGGKSILVGRISALKDPFFRETLEKSRWNTSVKGLFEIEYPPPLVVNNSFRWDGFFKKGYCIAFRGRRIIIINKQLPAIPGTCLVVDYLVISGGPKIRLKELIKDVRTGMIVLDTSNPPRKVKEWMKEAHELGIPCYSVTVSGAFRVEF